MTVGVLAAALSQGKLVGHEVDYIVGLGGTGAIATLLYLSIAFGKLTINTLNAYGSQCAWRRCTAAGSSECA